MTRVKRSVHARKKRRSVLERAKGYRGQIEHDREIRNRLKVLENEKDLAKFDAEQLLTDAPETARHYVGNLNLVKTLDWYGTKLYLLERNQTVENRKAE